jgi:protein-S-isoprenylcysteine O-methyltransferase Ste14
MDSCQKKLLIHQIKDGCIYWLLIPGLVLGSGKLIDLAGNWQPFTASPFIFYCGLAFIILGCCIVAAALQNFSHSGQGTANPRRPPKILVKSGAYALCRHPMFLGYDLTAIGVILFIRSPASLWISYPVFHFGQMALPQRKGTR